MSQTSGLNTMIVGPEAAGKTVLAAVLAAVAKAHPQLGLQFRAGDYNTKQYCDTIMSQLQQGNWPPSTRSGKPQTLTWDWGVHGNWYAVELIDPPGQDVREELTGMSNALGLDQKIRGSDLLILTIDVVSHQSATSEKRSQNGWIVEAVLQRFDPRRMNLIVVLTKADQLTHRIAPDEFGNREAVLSVLADLMPECDLSAYRELLQQQTCAAVAVAAVKGSLSVIDGQQISSPALPLKSLGLPNLVGKIVEALRMAESRMTKPPIVVGPPEPPPPDNPWEWLKKFIEREPGTAVGGGLSIAAVLFALILLLRGCEPEPVIISCPKCGGDGVIEGIFIDDSCSKCAGLKKIKVLPDGTTVPAF